MFRRGFLLWVYDFVRVVGIASFYVLCILPDELATMCVNWYNANPLEDSDKPSVSASDYKKIDIDPNATEIISPSEFAAPSVINGMIDHLAELEQNISIVEVN